jgi:hypothetical protein
MGLLSLSETIDLFNAAESIIQLPFDKLTKLYEKMFHKPIDKNVGNNNNEEENNFDENFNPDDYDMDAEVTVNSSSFEHNNEEEIENTSGTSVTFYYNHNHQPRYHYKIYHDSELELPKEEMIRMKMIKKITMNNEAVTNLQSKTENYFEKKSPMGAFFEYYGSIIEMTGTRPICQISLSPHGLFRGDFECGHPLGVDTTSFVAQLNVKSVINFFKDLRPLLLPYKDGKGSVSQKEADREFFTFNALYPKMERFALRASDVNPHLNITSITNIKALLYQLLKRRPGNNRFWELQTTLAPEHINFKFHIISDILISRYEYSDILKMDVEALRFVLSSEYPAELLLITELQQSFDEFYADYENWQTRPEPAKSKTHIYVGLFGTQTTHIEGRIKIHPESPAFKIFEQKLLAFKEIHKNVVRMIDSDGDDFSF